MSACASIFARSTPSFTRSFSMAELVAWEMPVGFASAFWLRPYNSRMIRTDSPTETITRLRATR